MNKKIVTYEAPIEYVYDNCPKRSSIISQTEVITQMKTWSEAVETAMRRKPDIILIGESRDSQTVNGTISAAQTGHLVYTTAHTNNVAQTPTRLINMFPEGERQAKLMELIDSTKLIIAQRLLKTIDNKKCAIKEYLVFDEEVKEQLKHATPLNISKLLDEIITNKRQRLIDDAYLRLLEGKITEKAFKKYEKEYGDLNLSEDEFFNLDDENIEYLRAKDFILEENKANIHCGVVVNLKSGNHGKIAYINKNIMSLETFSEKSDSFVSKTYNELNKTNKEIVLELKEMFHEQKNK